MNENDFLTVAAVVLGVSYASVRITMLALRHRASQKAADRKKATP